MWQDMDNYRKPGVLGLETLITKTSEYVPNARTPETKSSIDSAGDALFFPRLTASIDPGRSEAFEELSADKNDGMRARNRERTDAWP